MTDTLEALREKLRSVTVETKHTERGGYNEWCSKCVAQLVLDELEVAADPDPDVRTT